MQHAIDQVQAPRSARAGVRAFTQSLWVSLSLVGGAFLSGPLEYAAAEADVQFILDVSGSMAQKLNGERQIDTARKSLLAALDELNPNQLVALRVYAHRIDQKLKAESCEDTELLVPFQKPDRKLIEQKIANLTPRGWTPIARTLETARNDLLNVGMDREAERVIILLTDGEETCGGDAVGVLRKLRNEGFKLKVFTVGFNVNEVAQKELQAIAEFSGGKYFDARNADQLSSALKEATRQSAVLIDKSQTIYGTEIRGGDGFDSAVAIELGKDYRLDHHQRQNEFDYFFIEAKRGNSITFQTNTQERGIRLTKGGSFIDDAIPYAGIDAVGPNRDTIKKLNVIGKANAAESHTFTAAADGRYYFLVGNVYEEQHKDQVTFQVQMEVRGDAGTTSDAPDTIEGALPIEATRYPRNFIGAEDKVDLFSFEAKAGQQYLIGVIPSSSQNSAFRVRLLDEFKQVLASKDGEYNAGLKIPEVNIPDTGTYFLELRNNDNSSLEYALILKLLNTAKASETTTSEAGGESGGTSE